MVQGLLSCRRPGIESSQLCPLSSAILNKVLSASVAWFAHLEMGFIFLSSPLSCLRKEVRHKKNNHSTWHIQSGVQNPVKNLINVLHYLSLSEFIIIVIKLQ